MRKFVIYDSNYGNTKRIAKAIAEVLGVHAVHVEAIKPEEISECDLLIVGSPVNAWRPTGRMVTFLSGIKPGQLKHTKVATFDTRMKIFFSGNAAKKIMHVLLERGAHTIAPPQAFYVEEKDGPLEHGEIERAKKWAHELKHKVQGNHKAA